MLCTLVKFLEESSLCSKCSSVKSHERHMLIRLIRSPQWRRIERVALNGKVSVFLI